MVEHPQLFPKALATATPTSAQAIDARPVSLVVLGPLTSPKSLIMEETKSEMVMPLLFSAWTQCTTVLVMSNRVSASATCSLGFCTENHIKIGSNRGQII